MSRKAIDDMDLLAAARELEAAEAERDAALAESTALYEIWLRAKDAHDRYTGVAEANRRLVEARDRVNRIVHR